MSEQAKELIKSRVGKILRGFRKKKDLYQEELAAKLDITGKGRKVS